MTFAIKLAIPMNIYGNLKGSKREPRIILCRYYPSFEFFSKNFSSIYLFLVYFAVRKFRKLITISSYSLSPVRRLKFYFRSFI